MRSVSIIGCGYTGVRLARAWRARGAAVHGYATRAASLAAIAAAGATPCPLDLDREIGSIEVDDRLVYYAVPPSAAQPRLTRLLAAARGTPARIVYLGTTGVYGDRGGALVDEDTAPHPQSARAALRCADEAALRAWAGQREISWCILRIAGIYGPGRLPLARLRAAQPAILPAEAGPGNRIHVEDLVAACLAAATAAQADQRIYNVCDGTHDSMTGYLLRVARIAGLPPPPLLPRSEAERVLPESTWSFLSESRRVSNRRLLEELGVVLRHADLDEGIRASLAGE